MHARTGTLQVSPERVEDVVRVVRDEQLPLYRQQDGYKGFTVLADRGSGKVIGVSFWEDEDALRAADQLGREARAAAAEASGADEPAVDVFEVVLDDMA